MVKKHFVWISLHHVDEEDVFECGRCKEKFTDITNFMHHKRDKSCNKAKKQKEMSTKDTAQELGEPDLN